MISFWERASFLTYDFIIVGGGIVGFSTAISLQEKYPKASILVLEAGFLPSGASTKNAGFACVGSLSEIVDDLQTHSKEEVVELVQLRHQGLKLLRKRLGDNRLQYQASGSHELIFPHEEHLLEQVSQVNELLRPSLGDNVFRENKLGIDQYGLSDKVSTLIYNRMEGSIHTGKMMKHLIRKAQAMGVEYKTKSKVTKVEDNTQYVHVHIEGENTPLQATKVCVCTNAFAKSLLPNLALKPGRGQVLVSQPIDNLKLKGIFHFDQGYYYFREINGRVLFGGGRNIDLDEEETTEQGLNSKIQQDLEAKLANLILPNHAFEIDMRWSGIMAFGQSKKPIVKQTSEHIIAGVRLGGMGVAIGSKLGELLAQKIEI